MKLLLRLAAFGGLALALLALAAAGWAAIPGSGLADLPDLLRQLSEGERLSRDLDGQCRRTCRRQAAKQEVVEALVEGRLGLREAAERFRALNAEDPGAVEAARATYPSSSDEEAACRQVLAWVRGRLGDYPPERRAEVWARLESEGQSLLPGP